MSTPAVLPLNNVVAEFLANNMVRIKFCTDKGNQIKVIPFIQYAEMILSAKKEVESDEDKENEKIVINDTPIFPAFKNIRIIQFREVDNGSNIFIMSREAGQTEITYFDTKFENVGIPKLLFAIKVVNMVIQMVCVVSVKDEIITENTKIYAYPFSNTSSGDGKICFGGNRISNLPIKNAIDLHSIPDMFLAMPNNDDAYGNKNLSGLEFRPLLENLVGKTFEEQWLKPMNITYKEWFDKIR